jgi:hypothetical protein
MTSDNAIYLMMLSAVEYGTATAFGLFTDGRAGSGAPGDGGLLRAHCPAERADYRDQSHVRQGLTPPEVLDYPRSCIGTAERNDGTTRGAAQVLGSAGAPSALPALAW